MLKSSLRLALISAPFFFSLANAQTTIEVTKVITYKPTVTTGQSVSGYCWASSVAIHRADAWRCMAGNRIYDPCFSTEDNKVVCDITPTREKAAVIIQLTKPLPAAQVVQTETTETPWIVQLSDNSICQPYTGTMPVTNKGGIAFYCGNLPNNCHVGLLQDSIKPGRVWTATKVTYCSSTDSPTGLVIKQAEKVNITTIWH